MAKEETPKPATKRRRRPAGAPPGRGSVTKRILDDLTSPLVPADAAELFAVEVMDQLKELAPDVIAKFDRSWFNVFVDLATAVVNRCDEASVKATVEKIEKTPDCLEARVLRRRFARSLPAEAVNQLDDTGRYWLSVAGIEAVRELYRDDDLWDAMWGRKTGWFPVPLIAKEAPGADPAGTAEDNTHP